jgi:hypothetical protein
MRLALLAVGRLLLGLGSIILHLVSQLLRSRVSGKAHIVLIGLLLIIVILVIIVVVVLIILIKVLQIVLIELLKGKSFARKPVNGTWNKLLLDVLAELVVELQTLLDIGGGIIVLLGRGLRGGEEVEEGLGGDGLLDDAGLLGGYLKLLSADDSLKHIRDSCSLLLRCFFCSTRTVRS